MQENLISTIQTDFNEQIENSLRDLLEKILSFFEQLISTKEEVKFIEEQLNDYDSLVTLVTIINKLFLHLQKKITEKLLHPPTITQTLSVQNEKFFQTDTKDYELLEKVVQKYEAEIRNHIRVEQQLKLYGETLQVKLDDSEKIRNDLLESSKKLLNDIKRDNHDLVEKLQKITENHSDLEKKMKKVELDRTLLENQLIGLGLFPYRFQTIEKTEKTQLNTLNSVSNMNNNDTSFQRVNFELDYGKNENNIKVLKSRTPEKFSSKKKNFSPQALLNNLINNQKKEKKGITDCLKLKIEIARGRGSNDLSSKIMNMNLNANLNNKKFNKFPLSHNISNQNTNINENFQIKTDFQNKKDLERKKINQSVLQNNKSNSHNSSLAPNQSINDSIGIIRARSKSSHSKNNNSFTSTKNSNAQKANKKLDNSFHVMHESKAKEKNENKGFVLNYLTMKNQMLNSKK